MKNLKYFIKELADYYKKDIQYQGYDFANLTEIARKEIGIFLEEKMGLKKIDWMMLKDEITDKKIEKNLEILVNKRKKGLPLAHILKKQDFFGISFKVNRHTLIPRPETEELVECALSKIQKLKGGEVTLVDVGTGSGCIITAFCHNLPEKIKIKEVLAIDKSGEALKCAKINLKAILRGKYPIKFRLDSLLNPLIKMKKPLTGTFFIFANLPYLAEAEFKKLSPEVSKNEPKSALVSGKGGFELTNELISQALFLKKKNPKAKLEIFFEISPQIFPGIKKHLSQNLVTFETQKDLAGKLRILYVSI